MREAVIIPALDPETSMLRLVCKLQENEFHRIVVVDDGSCDRVQPLFGEAEDLGCIVFHHNKNLGKGEGLKTGIRQAIRVWGRIPVITVDADGQHLPGDIVRIAEEMESHPDALVLGVRSFSGENVPFRSRAGNYITSKVFRFMTGIACPDTQTGLRGIPSSLLDLALEEEGSRYEYEMNFLTDAVAAAPIRMIPIQTVYENGNRGSHFRLFTDSFRIYRRPIRFALASLTGAACDYTLFALIYLLAAGAPSLAEAKRVMLSTGIARLGSGAVNFQLNRRWSFRSANPAGRDLVRYLVLFFLLMAASAIGTAALSAILPAAAAKLIVDTALFFLSYRAQKNWVFRKTPRVGLGDRGSSQTKERADAV
jgi:glycosyltransferase involved in cell wall biosynthesis